MWYQNRPREAALEGRYYKDAAPMCMCKEAREMTQTCTACGAQLSDGVEKRTLTCEGCLDDLSDAGEGYEGGDGR